MRCIGRRLRHWRSLLHDDSTCSSIATQLLLPPCRTRSCTSQPTSVFVEVTAQYLRCSTILRLDIDVLELEPRTWRLFRAVYPRRNIIPTRASDILPCHIANLQTTCIAIAVRVYTWRDVYRLIHVDGMDVPECDVANKTLPRVCLDPCSVGAVDRSDVLENNVLDIIWDVGRVAE